MYANCYGLEGVTKAINIMKTEIVRDGAQMGATNLHNISMSFVSPMIVRHCRVIANMLQLNTRQLEQNVYLFNQQ